MLEAYILLIVFTVFGALGGFFLKRAVSAHVNLMSIFFNYNLYIGVFLYFISAVINIIVLMMLPYSVVLPCSAITYIWSLYLGSRFLQEHVTMLKIGGVTLVIIGVAIIMMSS